MTVAWLNGIISRAENTISLHRTIPLDYLLQTATVRDMIKENVSLINEGFPILIAEAQHA